MTKPPFTISRVTKAEKSRQTHGTYCPRTLPYIGGLAVAVGTAVTRCPPRGPVLALLAHTVLTSDRVNAWRQGARSGGVVPPSFGAAWRTHASPLHPISRLGVRHGLGCCVFSLVHGLPSATSAGGSPLLFGCFIGTTPWYDSPWPCMRDLPLITFSLRPAASSRRAATGSPGSRAWSFSACLGSSTPSGRVRSRAGDRPRVAFRPL